MLLAALSLYASGLRAAVLPVTVVDENSVPVAAAVVTFTGPAGTVAGRCETDYAGRCRLDLPAGTYRLTVSKTGFYQLEQQDVHPGAALDLVLTHVHEVRETVNVTESVPEVDPQRTSDTRRIDSQEIINVPYPTSRDIRNMLPLVPGVVTGPFGEAHVAGAQVYETEYMLDGFNVSQPATGFLQLRFSADGVRSIDVRSSRYSAEYGPVSGGVVGFESAMADDHYRFSATNFIPSAQFKNGLNFDKWVPRATFSGPIAQGKAWFLLAPEFELDHNVIKGLPKNADTNVVWRGSNLLKLQYNPSRHDVLTSDVLVNFRSSTYDALSLLNPISATTNNRYFAHFVSLREQHVFTDGAMLELGGASASFTNHSLPQGTAPYVITPSSVDGNFFENFRTTAGRIQGIANFYLPPLHAAGRHEIRLGMDAQRLNYDNRVSRQPIEIVRTDGSLSSRILFNAPPTYSVPNTQVSGYLQDRWSPLDRLVIESGVRFTGDRIVREVFFEPRVAASAMVTPKTKLSAGVALLHDPTDLELISRAYAGQRIAYFYASDGVTQTAGPDVTSFHLDPAGLHSPAFVNYSTALERQLFWNTTFSAEYLVRQGRNSLAYFNLSPDVFAGNYELRNGRHDRYHSLLVLMRHRLQGDHEVMLSYQRSSARSNAVLEPTVDNPVFSAQGPGPLAWDTPDRFLSWGWLPVPKTRRWGLAYAADWHTGIPFSVVNGNNQVVGAINSYRFPSFFSLDLFLELRFGAIGRNWALRGGFENITGHPNPSIVYNNTTSPYFLQFGQNEGRAFTARIRFLGRK